MEILEHLMTKCFKEYPSILKKVEAWNMMNLCQRTLDMMMYFTLVTELYFTRQNSSARQFTISQLVC